jgi:four helix bundle protein
MDIFEITKTFPKEVKFSLTDQLRRSSRSVPANIAEAWKKRSYPKMFVSKIIDAAGEAGETEVWLDVAKDANYVSIEEHKEMMKVMMKLTVCYSAWSKNLRNSVQNQLESPISSLECLVGTDYCLPPTAYCLLLSAYCLAV